MKITLTTIPEDISPEQAEKLHGYAEGFAESVKQVQDSIESSSDLQWGWCTVKVSVEIEDKYNGIKRVGDAYLGECSYRGAADFIANSCYFQDLVSEALNNARPVKLPNRATVSPESGDSSPAVEHSLSIQQDHLVNTRMGDYVTLKDLAEIQRQCESYFTPRKAEWLKTLNDIKHGYIYEVMGFCADSVTGKRLVGILNHYQFHLLSLDNYGVYLKNEVLNHVLVSLPSVWFRPVTSEELASSDAVYTSNYYSSYRKLSGDTMANVLLKVLDRNYQAKYYKTSKDVLREFASQVSSKGIKDAWGWLMPQVRLEPSDESDGPAFARKIGLDEYFLDWLKPIECVKEWEL